jgi:hypothetical protein
VFVSAQTDVSDKLEAKATEKKWKRMKVVRSKEKRMGGQEERRKGKGKTGKGR